MKGRGSKLHSSNVFFNPFQTGLFRFVLFFVWHYVNARVCMFVGPLLLGSLRNYDGDGNGNFKI